MKCDVLGISVVKDENMSCWDEWKTSGNDENMSCWDAWKIAGNVSPPFHSTPTPSRIRKIAQEMELMADSLSESIPESDDSESVLLEDSLSAAAHAMLDSSYGSEGDVAQQMNVLIESSDSESSTIDVRWCHLSVSDGVINFSILRRGTQLLFVS